MPLVLLPPTENFWLHHCRIRRPLFREEANLVVSEWRWHMSAVVAIPLWLESMVDLEHFFINLTLKLF